jgi:acyl carrier protein
MNKIETWLCEYVSSLDKNFQTFSDGDKLTCDIFQSTNLDSLGIMNVILDTEKRFSLSFGPDDFLDRRLRTLAGMSQIIEEKVSDQ